jgi:hypothetical protein
MRRIGLISLLVFAALPALAQTTDIDAFKDGPDEAKVHVSGFVCPQFIGHFERDAYGERNPSIKSDFCGYSALDGVYGTITLTPLTGPFDAKASLADEFAEQEGSSGKSIGEGTAFAGGGKNPIKVYTRTYETAALETLHYRIQFTVGTIGNWAVRVTTEYATPRDDDKQRDFLNTAFAEAIAHIPRTPQSYPAAPETAPGMPAAATTPAPPAPLAGPAKPR